MHRLKIIFCGSFLLAAFMVYGQDPLLHYDFNSCNGADSGRLGEDLTLRGTVECECGIDGQGLVFDGTSTNAVLENVLLDSILSRNISFSFYLKPEGTAEKQILFSYARTCNALNNLTVTYDGMDNSLEVQLFEDFQNNVLVNVPLPDNNCWYHIAIVKFERILLVYVNGELLGEGTSIITVRLLDSATLRIGADLCSPAGSDFFQGKLDEVKLFDRAITEEEVKDLYTRPDQLLNQRDTLIFKGDSVFTNVNNPCNIPLQWTPSTNILDPNAGNTALFPETTTTYVLTFQRENCTRKDSLLILVIDPDSISCEELLMPTAFTPDMNGLNDTYFISNGFIIEELISFEIFDRQGNRMFVTGNKNGAWDGDVDGEKALPGVYIYQIRYFCEGLERTTDGVFTLLR